MKVTKKIHLLINLFPTLSRFSAFKNATYYDYQENPTFSQYFNSAWYIKPVSPMCHLLKIYINVTNN